MITDLRNYAPTEIVALTPHGVHLLLQLLRDYSPEVDEEGLHSLLILQLSNCKAVLP
jgi:hypothetical protein